MTSEIRANTLKNRVGLGTISFTDTGAIVSGIVTANSFSGPIVGDVTGAASQITVVDESSDTTCNPVFVTSTSGNLEPKTGTNLVFNSASGNLRTGSLFLGSVTNESKTQDGLILERNSVDGEVHITAGRSGGNYNGFQFHIAGASGVTKRLQMSYDGLLRYYAPDGTTERLRIGTNGYVNIGTGTAEQQLTVQNSAQHSLIRVISKNNSDAGIDFGDVDDTDRAGIRYTNSTDTLGIIANADTRVVIDSSGRVMIGGGSSPSQVGDGRLIVYSSDKLHPGIKVGGTSNNHANGFTIIADNYTATESHVNLGTSYSSAGLVLSRSVKVSGTQDDVYLSSQAQYATRPSAFKLDGDGNFVFLNTSTNANTAVDSAVTLYERLRINSNGNVSLAGQTNNSDIHSTYRCLQVYKSAYIWGYSSASYPAVFITNNARPTTSSFITGWKRDLAGTYTAPVQLELYTGNFNVRTADDSTADSAIGWDTRFTVTQSGKIGINKSSPAAAFHMANDTASPYIMNENTGSNSSYTGFSLKTPTLDCQIWNQGPNGSGYGGANSMNFYQGGTYGAFAFHHGSDERFRISSDGKIGVNIIPSTKFEIKLSPYAATGDDDASDWGADGIFQLTQSGTAAANNEILLLGAASGAVGQLCSGFGFGRESTSNWGTYLSFKTHSTSTANIDELKERLRITANGQVGMGQDGSGNVNTRAVLELNAPFNDVSDNDGSAAYTMNNHDALLINFSGASYSSGTNVGSISWTNGGRRRAAIMGEYQHTDGDYLALSFWTRGTDGAGDFYRSFIINRNGSAGLHGALSQSTSDDRLKKDKVEITNALDKVNSLSSFTHKWNDIAVRAGLEEDKEEIGLSAQEVQGLYPCLVDVNNVMKDPEDPDTDYLTVHYAKVVPLLVASIKELTAKNKALEARLDALEGS